MSSSIAQTWTCARCKHEKNEPPKGRSSAGDLCCRCVEAMMAEFRVARCRAAVASPEERARIAAERRAARAAQRSQETDPEVEAAIDDELELPEEPVIYELAPEIAPADQDQKTVHVFDHSSGPVEEPEYVSGAPLALSRPAVTPTRVAVTAAIIATALVATWLMLNL